MAISNYTELQTAVANWLDRDDLSARIPEIRRIEGKLDGDINLDGPLHRPAVSATVSVVDGVVRTQMDLPVLEEIQLEALVSPTLIEIRRLQGLLGAAANRVRPRVQKLPRQSRLWQGSGSEFPPARSGSSGGKGLGCSFFRYTEFMLDLG